MAKATVIIPAYNEAKRIGKVLANMPRGYEVIVVDDGSTDNTKEVVKKHRFTCIRLDENKGKAEACMIGAKKAKTNNIIFIDADFQMDPREVLKFEYALKDSDLVLGKRDMSKVPLQRRLANTFAKNMILIITKRELGDALCGYRAIRKNALFKLALKKKGYEFESEMIIRACEEGLRIREIPVLIRYDDYSGMPPIKSLKVAMYLLKNALVK